MWSLKSVRQGIYIVPVERNASTNGDSEHRSGRLDLLIYDILSWNGYEYLSLRPNPDLPLGSIERKGRGIRIKSNGGSHVRVALLKKDNTPRAVVEGLDPGFNDLNDVTETAEPRSIPV